MSDLFKERQAKLQETLRERGLIGFLVTQNVDIYYYCGSMQMGYLFIPAEGEAVYMVRRSVQRAEEEAAAIVEALGSMKTMKDRLAARCAGLQAEAAPGSVRLATELDVLPVQLFQRLQAAFPDAAWEDGALLIREQRMIKSPPEVAAIREAARVVDAALEAVIPSIREGMAEFELMALIEHQLRLRGHQGLMRMRAYNSELITGMVASGASAAVPTYFDGRPGAGAPPVQPAKLRPRLDPARRADSRRSGLHDRRLCHRSDAHAGDRRSRTGAAAGV
ncbi:M24 family metallopeptidase [Paenibacillus hexagrammi]|uniref:M24 family metallopeptidase n=1 Tax=Paenibacillus hexagrammi TaxID=2908839 RepID=UPI00288307E3|nr:aminopeptidase P family N-terminal domain-containing protein [Paenibacillus sp. YPD9-1]